jgi:hypothetical protein
MHLCGGEQQSCGSRNGGASLTLFRTESSADIETTEKNNA